MRFGSAARKESEKGRDQLTKAKREGEGEGKEPLLPSPPPPSAQSSVARWRESRQGEREEKKDGPSDS